MYVTQYMEWYHKLNDVLKDKFNVTEIAIRRNIVKVVIHINIREDINNVIDNLLENYIEKEFRETAKYQLIAILNDLYRLTEGEDYYTFTRRLFIQIIIHNIYKTNFLITNTLSRMKIYIVIL